MSEDIDELALANARVRRQAQERKEAIAAQLEADKGPSQAQLDRARIDAEFNAIQQRADAVYRKYGLPAPQHSRTEDPLQYRKRLADGLKIHTRHEEGTDENFSKRDFSGEPLQVFADSERKLYAIAGREQNWRRPGDLKKGESREVVMKDDSGRVVHEFVSGAGSKMFREHFGQFMLPGIASPIYLDGKAQDVGATVGKLPGLPRDQVIGWD
jgi:hypothetical protein